MYPKTRQERAERKVEWETAYTHNEKEPSLEFKIFDKSGRVRAKLTFDKEDLESLRNIFTNCLEGR